MDPRPILADDLQRFDQVGCLLLWADADIRLLRRLFLTVDGRYLWAKGDLGRTWVDFDPIDLSGFRMTAGINFKFEEAR